MALTFIALRSENGLSAFLAGRPTSELSNLVGEIGSNGIDCD